MFIGEVADFVRDKNYKVLSTGDYDPGIGPNGRNLTISFLSLNRPSLSKRLLSSIAQHLPKFAGQIQITDNGSSPGVIDSLWSHSRELNLNVEIQELGRNYGVSGGRNRSASQVKTDWVCFLDNDIYFISDPIQEIDEAIHALGCKFLNLPLLDADAKTVFAYGGHLFIDSDGSNVYIGGGSTHTSRQTHLQKTVPFLSTFLFGGASVLNVGEFKRLGGFDEGMFVGFEDVDFSITLNRAGLKIGNATTISLVHDHSAPRSEEDTKYERARFSPAILKSAGSYFERKHGLKVWNSGVEEWIAKRSDELGLYREPVRLEPSSRLKGCKKKITLVVDTPNWAFANIAQSILPSLTIDFDVEIIDAESLSHDPVNLMFATRGSDLVHFFWREHLTAFFSVHSNRQLEKLGSSSLDYLAKYKESTKITTSVYDHLFLTKKEVKDREFIFNEVVDGYSVSSSKLYEIYSNLSRDGVNAPSGLIHDGVDLEKFRPRDVDRFSNIRSRPLVIGWVGNSKWGGEKEDHKGFHSILTPAVETLNRRGLRVTCLFADKASSPVPKDAMPDFYNALDILVCTSISEGTPNPILEAMASGVPVISTDVGIVTDVFGTLQREFIIERSCESLIDAIQKMTASPENLLELSRENLERIKTWGWDRVGENFTRFFKSFIEEPN